MANQKLAKISGAACGLFISRGYARTQIRDIAKAAGISVGAVYLHFTGKLAILDYVLQCDLDPGFANAEHSLPIGEEAFPKLHKDIMMAFYKNGIQFAEPVTGLDYSFPDLLSDAFDALSRFPACSLICENNPHDFDALGIFYAQYKQRFYETFLRFVRLNIESGSVRALPYPEYSARLMLENLFFWGVRAAFEDEELKEMLSTEERKAICMDAMQHAFQT